MLSAARIRLPRLTAAAAVIAALAMLAAGCGSSKKSSTMTMPMSGTSTQASASAGPTQSGHVKVAIKSYAFSPAKLSVKVGTQVTFTNYDGTAHTATANSGGFDTGTLQHGKSKTVTFKKVGTFPYHCLFHAFMTGTITVVK